VCSDITLAVEQRLHREPEFPGAPCTEGEVDIGDAVVSTVERVMLDQGCVPGERSGCTWMESERMRGLLERQAGQAAARGLGRRNSGATAARDRRTLSISRRTAISKGTKEFGHPGDQRPSASCSHSSVKCISSSQLIPPKQKSRLVHLKCSCRVDRLPADSVHEQGIERATHKISGCHQSQAMLKYECPRQLSLDVRRTLLPRNPQQGAPNSSLAYTFTRPDHSAPSHLNG
jgi:hypothetical protein